MTIRAAFLLLVFALVSAPVRAQQGSAGLAGQVATLTTQVATLQGQIVTLQGQVAKLEGNITTADLVGTYSLTLYQTVFFDPSSGSPAQLEVDANRGTLTLAGDGTGSGTINGGGGIGLFLSPPSVNHGASTGQFNFTWTYANGTVTTPGLPPLIVAAGGRLLISVGTSSGTGTVAAPLLILTRLQ